MSCQDLWLRTSIFVLIARKACMVELGSNGKSAWPWSRPRNSIFWPSNYIITKRIDQARIFGRPWIDLESRHGYNVQRRWFAFCFNNGGRIQKFKNATKLPRLLHITSNEIIVLNKFWRQHIELELRPRSWCQLRRDMVSSNRQTKWQRGLPDLLNNHCAWMSNSDPAAVWARAYCEPKPIHLAFKAVQICRIWSWVPWKHIMGLNEPRLHRLIVQLTLR